jgi:proteasome lid subunit RPN8/RPN11
MMLRLPQSVLVALGQQAQSHRPRECCGLVVGGVGGPEAIWPLPNIARSHNSFEAHPEALLAAWMALRGHAWVLWAIYHSHPSSPAAPSAQDLIAAQRARWRVPHIIIAAESIQAWWLDDGVATEIMIEETLNPLPDALFRQERNAQESVWYLDRGFKGVNDA